MLFVGCRVVNTVDTQEFLFVLTIKSDEVGMKKTLLRKLILIADSIKIQTSTHILFLVDEGINILNIFFL